MAKKKSKVIRYRRPRNINVGIIIFGVFFIYLMYNIAASFTTKKLQVYEVGEISSAVKDNTYDALILRDESTYVTDRAGYVNYYIRESSRASVGNTVYSIDEKGTYNSMLTSNADKESSLTEDQLRTLKDKLAAYSASYTGDQFSRIYDMKYSIQNLLLNYLGTDTLGALQEQGVDTSYLKTVTADQTGVVEYYCDGMEDKTENDLNLSSFDSSHYSSNSVGAGTSLKQGDFVYKLLTSESWTVYLPLTEEDIKDLSKTKKVYLKFNDVSLEAAGDFSLVTLKDGTVVGKCEMARYMSQLADRRYTSVTLLKSRLSGQNIKGLKIPKSAVITKDLYIIPESYAAVGGNDNQTGFIKEVITTDGTAAEFITPEIYGHSDGYYFISMDSVEEGTVLMQPEASIAIVDPTPETESETEETSEEETVLGESRAEASLELVLAAAEVPTESTSAETTTAAESTEETSSKSSLVFETTAARTTEENSASSTSPASSEASSNADTDSDGSAEDSLEAAGGEETEEETESSIVKGIAVELPHTDGRYTISTAMTKKGVLNINKGYCVFRQITILEETDDYYIISSNQPYGLTVYDHILLDGNAAREGEIIYR